MSQFGGTFEGPPPTDPRRIEVAVSPAAETDRAAEVEASQDALRFDGVPVGDAEREAELTAAVMGRHYLVVEPMEPVTVTDWAEAPHGSRQAIFVGQGEMVVHDRVHGRRDVHLSLPGPAPADARREGVVRRMVAVVVHKKPIGRKSLGQRYVLALDDHDRPLATVDNSMDYGANDRDVWEFNLDALDMMCRAVRLPFTVESYELPQDFIAARPGWAPPTLEFETHHRAQENTREWGLAIFFGYAVALAFTATGTVYFLIGPVGKAVGALAALGIVVGIGLTVFSHSRRRARRALRRRGLDPDRSAARGGPGGPPGARR